MQQQQKPSAPALEPIQDLAQPSSSIAAATALAGEMLGLKLIYLDAGSGAMETVNPDMVRAVKEMTSIPIIVGGGIRTAQKVGALHAAGADVVVIGTIAEENPNILTALSTQKAK